MCHPADFLLIRQEPSGLPAALLTDGTLADLEAGCRSRAWQRWRLPPKAPISENFEALEGYMKRALRPDSQRTLCCWLPPYVPWLGLAACSGGASRLLTASLRPRAFFLAGCSGRACRATRFESHALPPSLTNGSMPGELAGRGVSPPRPALPRRSCCSGSAAGWRCLAFSGPSPGAGWG